MKNISKKEFICYLVCGLFAAFGLILMIFGIIGHHMDARFADNFVKQFESKIVLDLRIWGVIFMAVGAIAATIVLCVYAKKADREVEKKIRREQRLAAQSSQTLEVKNAVEVVEEVK